MSNGRVSAATAVLAHAYLHFFDEYLQGPQDGEKDEVARREREAAAERLVESVGVEPRAWGR